MDANAVELFAKVVEAGIPYALTWTIGTWIVRTLMRMVTGNGDSI